MTSETYQDLSFDRAGKSGGKRPIRPKLLKLTDVTMPHRSRKKTKVKSKDRSQSTVRDRIYDDPAYTDDISHLANPLRRSSVSVGGSTGGKGDAAQHTGGSLGKRPKLSAKQQAKLPGSYEQDGSSSSDNGPPDAGKGNRGRSLERPERTEKSPKKRDTKRDRSSKQKRNLSLDNTQPGRRSMERGEGASKLASIDRSYRGSKIKSSGAPKPSPDMENWPEYAPPESSKPENEEAFSTRGKDSSKMQIGRKFLKGEIGIKSFNYYLLKEGLKSSKKFVEKQRNSLTGGLGSKKHISRSEENIYEEIFFKDRPSDTEEPQSQSQPPPHSIYPDCELCMQQCTKEDCEYCLQDNIKSKQQFGSLGRNDNRSSFASASKHQRQAQQQQQQQQTTPAAHILEFQSYNPNNPGVYKIETTPVAITGEYNPILQFQQQPQETHKQVPQQLQQHMPSHHSLQQIQLQSHYQQPTLPPIPQPRRTSRMPAANGAAAASVGGGAAANIQPPITAFIVGTGIGGSATIGLRVNNTKSSSSSDSLHHKYNTMARLEASTSADQYHQPPPPNYRMYRLGGHLGGSQILPEPSYDPKIYKSDSKVSIISEYSVRSSDNTSNRNFRCGEVSDSSLGDSMFSYSTQQRKYFGSSESCRFAFECRRCSLDGEKCSFSDTCRYECRNCDCSSSYFSSDFDDLNYGRKSSSSQKSYEYFNDSNLDMKQNKYAQDFFKHVNDVKRSIYQAELQRSSGADSNQSGGNGNHQPQQHHGHSGRYQQGRGSPFRNIKVPPAPPPSMYSTLPLAKDRVAARSSIKHNQPVPAPRSTMQQQNFSSLRKQSQHHQQHQQPAPLPRERGEYASLDRVVTHRTGTVPLSTATTGAIPKGTPLSQKLQKLPTNVPTTGAANQSNVNTTDKHQSPQPSPKLIKIKEKPERLEKQQAPSEQIPASVTMETDRKIITTPRKQKDGDAKPKKKATTAAKALDTHADVSEGRGAGSTLTRQKVTQSDVTQSQEQPPPPPALTNDKQASDLQAPKKDENDIQPPGCRLGNTEAPERRSPIPAIVEKPRSNEQHQIENVHNDKAFNDTTAGEVGPEKGSSGIGTGTTAATTTSPDEDDDVFYDARSEDSLSVGPRRRPKDPTHCAKSIITSPPTSPHNGTTAAAANSRKDTASAGGAITSPKVPATPPKPPKSTISCDTCCQLEESPISTRNASPVGSIVASTTSTSNMNSPHKSCVEYAPDKQVPQVAKPTSTGESSHQKSAHNPQVNETIITTNGNTNSGDLLQPSTESAAQHQPPVVATVAPTPTTTTTTTTTTDDNATNTIIVAASNAPATASTTSAVETSPVTISVTTSSAEEAVAGNKATSELSRDSDITGVAAPVTTNSELTPDTGGNSLNKRPPLARQEYSCIDSTSEAASTDDSHLTRESRHSSNDRSSVPDKIDISNLPLPALPPKKRRSRSRPISSAYPASSSITTTPEDNVKDPTHCERTPYQQYAARRRESLEASTRSFNEKLEARKMHYHSLSQTSAASTSQKPTYLFGENRSAKKCGDEIFLNKSGWVQVNTKRINDENSPGSHNRKANYLRHDSFQNGGIGAGNLKNTIRVIQIDNTGRDKPVYAVPKISGSKIEELISRNEARRNTSATRTYMKPGYKIVDPQIASILNERPGFLPVKTYLDSESPPPVTPILSPPPAFQDSKAKFERSDTAVRVQITTSSNPVKYDPNKAVKGGMVFSRSFEYDARKPPKDSYVETFSRSFDCNLSDKPPPQRDRSPNFSTLTGCSPNYLTKKENTQNKSRDNSPKYQQNLTTAYLNTSVKEAPPMYSQPRKLEKAKSQFDRNGRSRKAQFSSRLQTSAGGVGMVAPPSIANMSRFRSFDTSVSQRLNSCDSGARSDLSNDELDNEEDESTEFLTTNYHNISPYKQQRQRSLTPDRNDSHSSSSSLRKQRSITPESRSLTPEDRRKKGSQGSLGSRQNSGSRSNTLERNKKYEDKSLSASRSSSSSSYSGREHDAAPSTTAHRRSNARNAKAAEDHRIRRSRSLQLTERSPNRSHKMVVCVGQALPPNQPPIYHQSSIRSTVNSGFPPTIRTTTNQQTHQQILITNSNSNRNLRSSDIDKSRSFDFDYVTYSNQNVPTRLDFVDKSRSFDEDYREPSNNNGSASNSMRYLQTTDPGLRKVRKSSPIPSPQSSGTSSSTTLGPRQTSPQNYGTRLCDHELTYDMLRRSLDRSPIMDFSRDYDIPQSMKNRETINAGGNSELNFLSSSERIYDHPTTKRPNQSPSDSNYSLDRLHNSRDSLTPDSANEFKSLVTSDERLRSEYLYRQQQQRAHQGTNRGSSCTASTCDFWPHCGASFNQIVSKAKANKPQHPYNHHQHHQQQQQQQHRRHLHKQLSLQHQQQPQNQEQLKRQITVSAEVSNSCGGAATGLIRSDSRKSSSVKTTVNGFTSASRERVTNGVGVDGRNYQKRDSGVTVRSNVSKTSIRVEGAPASRPTVKPFATSSVSIFLGDCEMPITRERQHGSPTTSGTSSAGSGGRYGHSPSGDWTAVDTIRSRTSGNNTSTKQNSTLTVIAHAGFSETPASHERLRSVSLPNILNLSEPRFETTTTNDGVSVIGISSGSDIKRDLFPNNLQTQIRAVSSPSLSDHPSDVNLRNSNQTEYNSHQHNSDTHQHQLTPTTNTVIVNGHHASTSSTVSTGVLQKFKRTFSNFNKPSNGGNNSSNSSSGMNAIGAVQNQQTSTAHLQQIPVPVLEMGDNTTKYRFGPLIWRSSKERRKTKYNRRDKCNSGDSGIQIELENDEAFAGMEINGATLTSTPKARIRRANSAKATSSPTSALTAKAKALKKMESYDSRMAPASLPARRSLSQPSGLDRVTRTDLDESDTDSVSSHPDSHEVQHRPMYAEVLHNFTPASQQELALERGNLVEILRKEVGPWWYGRIKNDAVIETLFEPQLGWFPKDFVRVIQYPESDGTFISRQRKVTSPSLDDTLVATPCSISPNNVTTIVVDHPIPDVSPKKTEQEAVYLRNNAVKELLETEINYVKLLGSLCTGYLPAMRKRIDIFSTESLNLIFSNIENIWKFQQNFLDSLRRGIELDRIAQVFLQHQSGFLVYSTYCNSYPRALIELETYSRSKDAKTVLENCRQAENLPELPLSAHLLAPIQRICRYPLHLAELIKSSYSSGTENGEVIDEIDASLLDIVDSKEILEAALKAMRKVTEAVNEGKRHSENLARHQSSFENFTGPPLHFHSTRYFTQIDATRVSPNLWNNTYTLFLFDHQLIYCKKDILKRNHFIYKGRIFLDNCRILNLPDGKIFGATVKNALRIYCESRNKWFDFSFRSANRKKRFLSTLALERQFCGKNLFISELAGDEEDNLSDREYHSDYEAMTTTAVMTPNGESHYSSVQLNWKENVYDEKSLESPAKLQKYSDTLPKKSRQVNSKEGYEYNTGSLGRRRIGNWFRKSKSTNSTPNQSPTHNPSVIIFNSDSSSQSSPALGKGKSKDSSGSSS